MNKSTKILFGLLAPLTAALVSCEEKTTTDEQNNYTLDSYDYQILYRNSGKITFDIYNADAQESCRKFTYKINKYIGSFNYIKLEFETDTDTVGWITYCDAKDASKTNTEKFFVKAGDTSFTTFLDAYRFNCHGNFETKEIQSITLQGVDSSKRGQFELKSFGIADKKYFGERMYIDDGTIKLGTSARFGGAVEWLERIDINVIEYIDSGGYVRIDKDIDPNDVKNLISSEVNMVNIYDLGREIQPSYYLRATTENGYHPQTAYNYPSLSGYGSYNPIQCGGVGDPKTGVLTGAQIIDYEYQPDHIYIKSKGQDWMYVNDQAEGYIEVRYSFDKNEDGLLVVDNAYTDFYQFKNLESENLVTENQETPATYFVYPLNYCYMETKNRTIFDPNLKEIGSGALPIETSNQALTGDYYMALKDSYMKNACDWMACVNDQYFGAGIFMPNADRYIASRGKKSCKYSETFNTSYTSVLYDFTDEFVPSYAAANYNYMNPSLRRKMIEFVPLEFTYALYIGDTVEMRNAFAGAKARGLTNNNLTESEGTWPKK